MLKTTNNQMGQLTTLRLKNESHNVTKKIHFLFWENMIFSKYQQNILIPIFKKAKMQKFSQENCCLWSKDLTLQLIGCEFLFHHTITKMKGKDEGL